MKLLLISAMLHLCLCQPQEYYLETPILLPRPADVDVMDVPESLIYLLESPMLPDGRYIYTLTRDEIFMELEDRGIIPQKTYANFILLKILAHLLMISECRDLKDWSRREMRAQLDSIGYGHISINNDFFRHDLYIPDFESVVTDQMKQKAEQIFVLKGHELTAAQLSFLISLRPDFMMDHLEDNEQYIAADARIYTLTSVQLYKICIGKNYEALKKAYSSEPLSWQTRIGDKNAPFQPRSQLLQSLMQDTSKLRFVISRGITIGNLFNNYKSGKKVGYLIMDTSGTAPDWTKMIFSEFVRRNLYYGQGASHRPFDHMLEALKTLPDEKAKLRTLKDVSIHEILRTGASPLIIIFDYSMSHYEATLLEDGLIKSNGLSKLVNTLIGLYDGPLSDDAQIIYGTFHIYRAFVAYKYLPRTTKYYSPTVNGQKYSAQYIHIPPITSVKDAYGEFELYYNEEQAKEIFPPPTKKCRTVNYPLLPNEVPKEEKMTVTP